METWLPLPPVEMGCRLSLCGTWEPAFPCTPPELSHWGGSFPHTGKIIEMWHSAQLSEQPQHILLTAQCWATSTASADTAAEDFISSFGILIKNKLNNVGPKLSLVGTLLDLAPLITIL